MILAGDVGGTKVRLALYEHDGSRFVRGRTETIASAEFCSLEDVVNVFIRNVNKPIEAACFGVPGPVINGSSQATNLTWKMSEKALVEKTGLHKVRLVNDLFATAAAVPHLTEEELLILHRGEQSEDDTFRCAVLAPGTGCGQAFLYRESGRDHIYASEGGHVNFAPHTEIEIELLLYLKSKFGRVSYERILCGSGLMNIYTFLKERHHAEEPDELGERLQNEDPAAVITTTGLAEQYEISVRTLDIFTSILGAHAGNLMLTYLAMSGIYLGGGIPPKIIKKLADGTVR
ncbi:MAG: glucokinase, partial [Desulfobacterales bacterium]